MRASVISERKNNYEVISYNRTQEQIWRQHKTSAKIKNVKKSTRILPKTYFITFKLT